MRKPIGCLLAVILMAALFPTTAPAQTEWSPLARLSLYNGVGVVAASGNTAHFVYRADSNQKIYYRRSSDGGVTWGPEVKLFNSTDTWIKMAAAGSTVHVVYVSDGVNTRDLFYQRSTDAGLTWEPARRITGLLYPFRTDIAVSGSRVHIVFMDRLWSGEGGVYGNLWHIGSADGGATWGAPQLLVAGGTSRPTVAVDQNVVHVAWSDWRDMGATAPEIYYKRSTNGGLAWEQDRRLTDNPEWSGRTVMASNEEGMVYLLWEEWGTGSLVVAKTTDQGQTWQGPYSIASGAATHSDAEAVGSALHVIWSGCCTGGLKPSYYGVSADGGLTWASPFVLDNDYSAGSVAATSSYVVALVGNVYYRRRDLQQTPPPPPPTPLAVAITVPQPGQVFKTSDTATIQADIGGGVPPYTASVRLDGPNGLQLCTALPCSFGLGHWEATPGPDDVTVWVGATDSSGAQASSSVSFVVEQASTAPEPPALAVQITNPLSGQVLKASGTLTVQAEITGGTAPYKVSVRLDGPNGYQLCATLPCKFGLGHWNATPGPDNVTIWVGITDAVGAKVSAFVTFIVQ